MKCLVTGVAGFLGSNLAGALLNSGHEVTGLDYSDKMLVRLKDLDIKFVKGDIRNQNLIKKLIKEKYDVVFHLAGQVSHFASQKDPYTDLEINIKGILNILEALKNYSKDTHLVFASSRSVYGKLRNSMEECINNPIKETELCKPIDAYGVTKLMSERYCSLYNYHYNIPTTCLRMANLFGPRQQLWTNEYQMISWIFRCIMREEIFTFMGTGEQTRDFLYVDDAIKAYLLCMNNKETVSGEVYNLGGASYTTWNDAMRICSRALGKPLKVKYIDYTPLRAKLENPHSKLDYAKIELALSWEPYTNLFNGFLKMKEYYEDNIERYL